MKKYLPFILTALLISCSLFTKLAAPKYNAVTYQYAVTADSVMTSLYSSFKSGGDLSYANSAASYDYAQSTINNKINLDSVRKYPTQILSIDRSYLSTLEAARQDHQTDGNISKNHINVNGALLHQIGDILVNTEKTYK